MTTIRNFDALNDVENLIHSGKCITDAGLHHQVCVTMMELPPGCVGAHDADFYESTLRQILDADIPFDSVCFKDASGTAVPSTVHESIKRARKMLPEGTFIHFHTHETAGISVQANMAALEAGADAIDLSLAPCSGGTCQPDVLVMWHALRGSDYDLDVDVDKVRDAEEVFKECMAEYFLPPEAIAVEPMIPWSPMPGGALTANTQMLRDNGIMDRYPEMIKAMGEVVERGGFGTSVTPVSQFYFQQAFNNVMMGPWQRIADDYGRMVLGYFGKTPVPPDPEVVKLAADQLEMEPTDRPPLELNDADPKKGVAAATQRLSDEELPISDENIFIVAACGDKGIAYLKGDAEMGVRKIDPTAADPAVSSGGTYSVRVDGTSYDVSVEGGRVNVGGRVFDVAVSDGTGVAEAPTDTGSLVDVVAQMPGKVIRIAAEPGAWVEAGDPVIVIEAMRMEVPVPAPSAGEVAQVHVAVGEQIPSGASLASLKGS